TTHQRPRLSGGSSLRKRAREGGKMLSSSTAPSLRLHHHQPARPRRRPPAPAAYRQFQSPAAASRRHLPAGAAVRARGATIRAIDAAQPFDYESRAAGLLEERQRLKIAIVGFGNFGQFLARTFARQGHTLLAHSRSDHSSLAASLGAAYFQDPHDLCECHPDVVLLATSILSAEAVLRSLPLHRLRRSTLFVDVLSVKEFPKNLLLTSLPEGFDILCTHPMFGPESARDGWDGLPFVFDRVRVGDSPARRARANAFLNIFEREGCRMVEMCCAEHDAHAAETQFLTHTVGRMLATLELSSTPINTKGYETLLRLVDNTCSDSFDLYNGLFMYNKNSTDLLNRLESAMDSVKKRLFDGLHEVLRKQLFEGKASPPNTATTGHHADVHRRQLLLEGKPPSPSVPTPNNVTVPK
uniref:Prephenate/arogenate dehydrogenase domain-containing protein n=3 Tax=Triticinae TaxID=1648030 RepID=A0A453SMB4_AEGTS